MSKEAELNYRKGISVVIPAYNAEKTLAACVESVLAQDITIPMEVLLVNDGSTDATGRICDEFAARSGVRGIIIRAHHIRNLGVSHARNEGMDAATMEYLTFVDADDTLKTDCLSALVKALEQHDALMSCESDRIYASHPLSGSEYVEHGVLNGDTHVWGKVYRHSYLVSKIIRFPEDLKIGEDMTFLLALSLVIGKEARIICIPRGGYRYTENPEGAMLCRYNESYLDQIYCWQRARLMMLPFKEELPESAFEELSVIRIMSAMLVVGKIAELKKKRWKDPDIRRALTICRDEIRLCMKHHRSYLLLSAAYKAKVALFYINRRHYLLVYRWLKRRSKRSLP